MGAKVTERSSQALIEKIDAGFGKCDARCEIPFACRATVRARIGLGVGASPAYLGCDEAREHDDRFGSPPVESSNCMSTSWQTLLLDALDALDLEEAPHGLYGILQAHAANGKLPTLAYLLASPTGKLAVLRRAGLRSYHRRLHSDDLGFAVEGVGEVALRVLDYATTKVRHYGSAYRLDTHHAKETRAPDWELESLLPKLRNLHPKDVHGVLLVAHFAASNEIAPVLGRSTDPVFLNRYRLAHLAREWEDRQGRVFQTAVHLWHRIARGEQGAAPQGDPASSGGSPAPT